MQFDVIIGNPPYQITGGGGGTNDSPIYDLFVRQAMRLEPRFLSMVIPSRWMAGGRGLGEFRAEFLATGAYGRLLTMRTRRMCFPRWELAAEFVTSYGIANTLECATVSTTEMARPSGRFPAIWTSSTLGTR